MNTGPLLDKYSAELVEELLNNSSKEGGELWFTIIRRKMKRAMEAMEKVRTIKVSNERRM